MDISPEQKAKAMSLVHDLAKLVIGGVVTLAVTAITDKTYDHMLEVHRQKQLPEGE